MAQTFEERNKHLAPSDRNYVTSLIEQVRQSPHTLFEVRDKLRDTMHNGAKGSRAAQRAKAALLELRVFEMNADGQPVDDDNFGTAAGLETFGFGDDRPEDRAARETLHNSRMEAAYQKAEAERKAKLEQAEKEVKENAEKTAVMKGELPGDPLTGERRE